MYCIWEAFSLGYLSEHFKFWLLFLPFLYILYFYLLRPFSFRLVRFFFFFTFLLLFSFYCCLSFLLLPSPSPPLVNVAGHLSMSGSNMNLTVSSDAIPPRPFRLESLDVPVSNGKVKRKKSKSHIHNEAT